MSLGILIASYTMKKRLFVVMEYSKTTPSRFRSFWMTPALLRVRRGREGGGGGGGGEYYNQSEEVYPARCRMAPARASPLARRGRGAYCVGFKVQGVADDAHLVRRDEGCRD